MFDDAKFGYRRGRSTKDALCKVWKAIESGSEWVVDAATQLRGHAVLPLWPGHARRWNFFCLVRH